MAVKVDLLNTVVHLRIACNQWRNWRCWAAKAPAKAANTASVRDFVPCEELVASGKNQLLSSDIPLFKQSAAKREIAPLYRPFCSKRP